MPKVTSTPAVHSTRTPSLPAVATPQIAADPAVNAVPLAATDGADLATQTGQSPNSVLLTSGLLLLMAGAVLSFRRRHAQ